MSRQFHRIPFILAVLALLGLGNLVQAAEQPIELEGVAVAVRKEGPVVHGVFEGNGSHVGQCSGTFSRRIFGDLLVAEAILEAANGDLLVVPYVLEFDRDTGVFVGTFSLDGGTGRFANATGGGFMSATPTPEGTLFFLDGVIDY